MLLPQVDGALAERIVSLQSLRGLAALAVVIFHLDGIFILFQRGSLLFGPDAYGWLGVDLFFVLSGFLLGPRFFEDPPPRARRFFLERFLRIAPAYYVAAVLSAVAFILVFPGAWNPLLAATNLVFLENFRADTHASLNGAFWSLAVEMQFYLVLPFAARWFRGRSWPWALALLMATSMLFRGLTHGRAGGQGWAEDPWTYLGTFSLLAFVGHFAAGFAAARIGSVRRPLLACLAGLSLVALTVGLFVPPPGNAFGSDTLVGQALVRPLVALGFALIILAAASTGPLRRALEIRPLVVLGDMSYSLYLAHLPVQAMLLLVIPAADHPLTYWCAGLAASLAAGWLLFAWVERPSERWRRARVRHLEERPA